MSKKENYEKKTEELLKPIVEKYNVFIYDVEFVKEGEENYLRAYIDKKADDTDNCNASGVTINDCELVSRALSEQLDREDYIEESYILEVSSPGLCRQLKKDKHFESAIGKKIEIKTYKPIEGCKDFEGVLVSYQKDTIVITDCEAAEASPITFDRGNIALARLAYVEQDVE